MTKVKMQGRPNKPNKREARFIEAYVETGSREYAGTVAGWHDPARAATRALERPVVAEQVAKRERERITNDLLPLAVDRVERILRDDKESTRTVLAAAKLVFDRALGADAGQVQKQPHEMTADELAEQLDRLRARQHDIAESARDVTPTPEEPDPGAIFG